MLTRASTNTDNHEDYLKPSTPEISWYKPNTDEWSVPQKLAQPTADSSNSDGEQIKRLRWAKVCQEKVFKFRKKTLIMSRHNHAPKRPARCLIIGRIFFYMKKKYEEECGNKINTFNLPSGL